MRKTIFLSLDVMKNIREKNIKEKKEKFTIFSLVTFLKK